MGGKVSVCSKEGKGTTFVIELTTLCKISNFNSKDLKQEKLLKVPLEKK